MNENYQHNAKVNLTKPKPGSDSDLLLI